MALIAFLGPQPRRPFRGRFFGAREGRSLGFHNRQRIALFARRAVVAVPSRKPVTVAGAIIAGAIIAGAIIAGTVVTWTVVTGSVVPRPVITRAVVTRTVIAGAIAAAVAVSWAVVAIAVTPFKPVAAFTGPIALEAVTLTLPLAVLTVLRLWLDFRGFNLDKRLGAALVLEIDVVAGSEGVAPDDVADRPGRLGGADQAEIMFGVLQIILRQHPVTAAGRVARQLLVLVKYVLSIAANLDPLGTIGIERTVGVVLLRFAAAAATAAITAALPFHTLEVSHISRDPRGLVFTRPVRGFLVFLDRLPARAFDPVGLKTKLVLRLPPIVDADLASRSAVRSARKGRRDLEETSLI